MTLQTSQERIRVLLVEDEEITRIGVSLLLKQQSNIELVDAVANFDDALVICARSVIHVVLLDLYLNDTLASIRLPELLNVCNRIKILLFTNAKSISNIHIDAIRNGANGLVLKHHPIELLLKAIESVNKGEVWIDRSVITQLLRGGEENSSIRASENANSVSLTECNHQSRGNKFREEFLDKLTQREKRIALLAFEGMSVKQIGSTLSIAEKTVRNNLTIIYAKLGVSSRIELCLRVRQD